MAAKFAKPTLVVKAENWHNIELLSQLLSANVEGKETLDDLSELVELVAESELNEDPMPRDKAYERKVKGSKALPLKARRARNPDTFGFQYYYIIGLRMEVPHSKAVRAEFGIPETAKMPISYARIKELLNKHPKHGSSMSVTSMKRLMNDLESRKIKGAMKCDELVLELLQRIASFEKEYSNKNGSMKDALAIEYKEELKKATELSNRLSHLPLEECWEDVLKVECNRFGGRMIMSKLEELELKEWHWRAVCSGTWPTALMMRMQAANIVKARRPISCEFKGMDGLPSMQWYEGWKKRNNFMDSYFKFRIGMKPHWKLKEAWFYGLNSLMKQLYMNCYMNEMDNATGQPLYLEFPAHCIWNMDESGFSRIVFRRNKNSHFAVMCGKDPRLTAVAHERKELRDHITMIPCWNAAGDMLTPLYLLRHTDQFHTATYRLRGVERKYPKAQCYTRATGRGYMNTKTLRFWLDTIFIPQSKVTPINPQILILDNENARFQPDILTTYKHSHGVYIYLLPPNCTDVLQPLDQACIFGTVKLRVPKLIQKWVAEANVQKVNNQQIDIGEAAPGSFWDLPVHSVIPLLNEVIYDIKGESVKKAFANCGLYPLNSELWPKEMWANDDDYKADAPRTRRRTKNDYVSIDMIKRMDMDSNCPLIHITWNGDDLKDAQQAYWDHIVNIEEKKLTPAKLQQFPPFEFWRFSRHNDMPIPLSIYAEYKVKLNEWAAQRRRRPAEIEEKKRSGAGAKRGRGRPKGKSKSKSKGKSRRKEIEKKNENDSDKEIEEIDGSNIINSDHNDAHPPVEEAAGDVDDDDGRGDFIMSRHYLGIDLPVEEFVEYFGSMVHMNGGTMQMIAQQKEDRKKRAAARSIRRGSGKKKNSSDDNGFAVNPLNVATDGMVYSEENSGNNRLESPSTVGAAVSRRAPPRRRPSAAASAAASTRQSSSSDNDNDSSGDDTATIRRSPRLRRSRRDTSLEDSAPSAKRSRTAPLVSDDSD